MKQMSCESGLSATARPRAAASARTCGLGRVAEREHRAVELVAGQHGQHVRLVLGRVDRAAQQAVGAEPGVVAGDHGVEAERERPVQHRGELDLLVAAQARVRGTAGGVLGDEVVDHVGVELARPGPRRRTGCRSRRRRGGRPGRPRACSSRGRRCGRSAGCGPAPGARRSRRGRRRPPGRPRPPSRPRRTWPPAPASPSIDRPSAAAVTRRLERRPGGPARRAGPSAVDQRVDVGRGRGVAEA